MTEGNLACDLEEPAGPVFAGLAGTLEGHADHRPPLILLHGLAFDRTMWQPAVAELRQLDPGRRVFAVEAQDPFWYGANDTTTGVVRVTLPNSCSLILQAYKQEWLGFTPPSLRSFRRESNWLLNFCTLKNRGPSGFVAWTAFAISTTQPHASELLAPTAQVSRNIRWRIYLFRPSSPAYSRGK